MAPSIQVSTIEKEGAFQASKWLRIQALLSGQELEMLLKSLIGLRIFSLRGVVQESAVEISQETFLLEYSSWIEQLKKGALPTQEQLSRILSCAWTVDTQALYLVAVSESTYLVKPRRPVVLVQAHYMGFSETDQTFRPMVLGKGSIFWGLQFSFPQIFQMPKTQKLVKVDRSSEFSNTQLFTQIRRWMREMTRPTPFQVAEKRIHIPIRLGKDCFSWIKHHPKLQEKHISVYVD